MGKTKNTEASGARTFLDFLLLILGIVIIIVSLQYGFGALKSPGPVYTLSSWV